MDRATEKYKKVGEAVCGKTKGQGFATLHSQGCLKIE